MIKKLIINADDFGMCEGNSLGILLAHEEGLVSSTTVMMNMPYALWALDKAKAYPDLGIGVHLTLTAGKPLLPGKKSYTDEEGNFLRPSAYICKCCWLPFYISPSNLSTITINPLLRSCIIL